GPERTRHGQDEPSLDRGRPSPIRYLGGGQTGSAPGTEPSAPQHPPGLARPGDMDREGHRPTHEFAHPSRDTAVAGPRQQAGPRNESLVRDRPRDVAHRPGGGVPQTVALVGTATGTTGGDGL